MIINERRTEDEFDARSDCGSYHDPYLHNGRFAKVTIIKHTPCSISLENYAKSLIYYRGYTAERLKMLHPEQTVSLCRVLG